MRDLRTLAFEVIGIIEFSHLDIIAYVGNFA